MLAVLKRSAGLISAITALFLLTAAIGFQDNLFKYVNDPRAPFPTTEPPPAPDYASDEAWALRPEKPDESRPQIFFVHPTTYWGGSAWNADIHSPGPSDKLTMSYLPSYAGPFMPLGQLWAPLYRQASLYSALTHRYDARQARALAYGDVARSFERFLSEIPADAPVVIVGIEQGGLHVAGLAQHMLRGERLMQRLAAVYILEQPVPLDLFDGQLSHLRPCRYRADVRCIVTYGALRLDHPREIQRFRNRSMTWTEDGRLEATEGRALACVNPVLGTTTEDYAPHRLHRGGVNATGIGANVTPVPLAAQTSSQCSNGVLLVDRPPSTSLRPAWRWGGRFKPAVANLFYADLELDARRRVATLAATVENEGRIAPPLDGVVTVREAPINRVDD